MVSLKIDFFLGSAHDVLAHAKFEDLGLPKKKKV